jgi:diadenosine tetraphosphatase ApaH/serine/threonine PP2A family protein phosphatase
MLRITGLASSAFDRRHLMIALLYDVHGNLPALEAVLADVGAQPDGWVIGGDVALFGPWPAETLARLRKLPGARWLRGNGERWVASPGDAPDDDVVQGAIAAGREALGAEAVAELGRLPESIDLGDGTRCWHGSPVSDVRSFLPEPAGDEAELLAGVTDRRLVFGHTHLPFRREAAGGIELVNPGSVGMPLDGDRRAAYAVLHPDGRVEHRRVAYDHEASAAAVGERFAGTWTATVAARIRQARFVT